MPEQLDPARLDLATDPELASLLAACPDIAPLRFRDGECLVVEGEDTLDLFIVCRGSLVVERSLPDGTQRALAQLTCSPDAPCIIGEMASLGAARRSATVRAVGSCQALQLQPTHLDAIIAGFPGLTRLLCRQFTLRLREAIDDLRDLRGRFELGATRRMAQAGELIHTAGTPAAELIQVAMGSVQIGTGEGARVLRPEELPGGFLDLEAFLRGTPHSTSASAAEPCFLAVIDADHREAFVRNQPQLVLQVLRD